MRHRRLIAALLLSAPLLLGASTVGGISPGLKAPEAAGIVLQGPPGIKLSALRGQVVVLDFWASWCGPCIMAMPELSQLHDELRREGYGHRATVLGVGVDNDASKAREFLRNRPVSYPVVVDVAGIALQSYGVWRLPATMIITPQGDIHYIYWGAHAGFGREIKQQVMALLKAQPVPARPPVMPAPVAVPVAGS